MLPPYYQKAAARPFPLRVRVAEDMLLKPAVTDISGEIIPVSLGSGTVRKTCDDCKHMTWMIHS